MGFVKFLPHALIIAILAAILQSIDIATGSKVCAWIAFQGWALYFLAGCTIKGGAKSLAGWICGVIASIIIIEFGLKIQEATGNMAFPIAVFVIAFIVILFEKVPPVSFIPAWFISAGGYFALGATDMGHNDKAIVSILSGIVGLLFGVVTVYLRGKYGQLTEAKSETAEEKQAA